MNNDMPTKIVLPEGWLMRNNPESSALELKTPQADVIEGRAAHAILDAFRAMNARQQVPQSAVDVVKSLHDECFLLEEEENRTIKYHGFRVEHAARLIQAYAQRYADAQCAPLVEALEAGSTILHRLTDAESIKATPVITAYAQIVEVRVKMHKALTAYHKAKGE